MTAKFARLVRKLFGVRSPSEWVFADGTPVRMKDFQARMVEGFRAGMERSDARRAELLASGRTPEEAQAAMLREMVADPGFAAMLEWSRGVVMRSFGSLYEDGEDGEGEAPTEVTDAPPSASGP